MRRSKDTHRRYIKWQTILNTKFKFYYKKVTNSNLKHINYNGFIITF